MILAVSSDVHDNIWALENALPRMAEADALLFCGDFCAPFTLVQMAEGAGGRPLHIVWGNNDGDRWLLTQNAGRFENVTLHGELAFMEFGGVRVGATHYPEIAEGLVRSGSYDAVCYGHDHTARQDAVGDCRILNPGELMGRFGRSTFLNYDTDTGKGE
ncbi:YfcE family phosphodiesterase, partial [Candidatus Latescibacterota bacterium]